MTRDTHIGTSQPQVDICIVVEGCYPFVLGGVSSWLDWLIRKMPETTFGVVTITATPTAKEPVYELPPNVMFLQVLPLATPPERPKLREPRINEGKAIELFVKVLRDGDLEAYSKLADTIGNPTRRDPFPWAQSARPPTVSELLGSKAGWRIAMGAYKQLCPQASFLDFFWAWRNLVGGMLALLTAPVPKAKAYHAISTGYAGLFAAHAATQQNRAAGITEHGIYTNERRIDIIMADWIHDTIQTEFARGDTRHDIRDFWTTSFESFSKIAYAASGDITTLYGENQLVQRALGAAEHKLRVIPNGIELDKFANLPVRTRHQKPAEQWAPTVALIGRVVPIKDIEGFIAAAAIVRRAFPMVNILIIGPTDEDPAYYELCKLLVQDLGLSANVYFTGRVNILDYMPEIDVLVLTSISEAQPLVLLEAGAAHVPCVATDVGSCAEIIEGTADETPHCGSGGRIAPAMDTDAIGAAIVELLQDEDLRIACGNALHQRVITQFTSAQSAEQYKDLYAGMTAS